MSNKDLTTADENTNVVTLDKPLKRGEILIDSVTVIRPTAGALRGVGLADVANAQVDALLVGLPRITYPSLTKEECNALELPDLVALAGKVIGFLSPNSEH